MMQGRIFKVERIIGCCKNFYNLHEYTYLINGGQIKDTFYPGFWNISHVKCGISNKGGPSTWATSTFEDALLCKDCIMKYGFIW